MVMSNQPVANVMAQVHPTAWGSHRKPAENNGVWEEEPAAGDTATVV